MLPAEESSSHRGLISYDHQTKTHLTQLDRKSTRLNSSHSQITYAGFCLNNKLHDACDLETLGGTQYPVELRSLRRESAPVHQCSRRTASPHPARCHVPPRLRLWLRTLAQ